MDLDLEGRVYIVTGASSGLGQATAAALVADGAQVVISARSADRVQQAAAELGPSAVGLAADLADEESPPALIELALERFGRLDGALVSSGGPKPSTLGATTDAQWRSAFEPVFLGPLRMAREVTERLDTGGSVGLVLSSSVRAPLAGLAVSNGFRPGLAMAAKTLADEVGPRGIRVFGLAVGRILTNRTIAVEGSDPGARARSEANIPLGRLGTPAEFGRVAAFLLSPAASYITGSVIAVDGGSIRSL